MATEPKRSGQASSSRGKGRKPVKTEQCVDVLAAGKSASSPSSPSSPAAAKQKKVRKSDSGGCLRVTPGGSGRDLALRCARRRSACAGDGQTDASGGGSELQIAQGAKAACKSSVKSVTKSKRAARRPTEATALELDDRPRRQDDRTDAEILARAAAKPKAAPRTIAKKMADFSPGVPNDPEPPKPINSSRAQEKSTMQDSRSLLRSTQVLNDEPTNAASRTAVAAVVGAVHSDQVPPKRCVGLDLGKKTAFCEMRDGQVVKRATLTKKADFKELLGPDTEPARVALEAGRSAWYYHDLLVSWGHEVLVVDTTRVRALGIGNHKRKNDRIDAGVLARAVEAGRVPLAHVLSVHRRQLRATINIRRTLVQTRASMVTTIRGLLRSWGVEQPTCDTDNFLSKIEGYQKGKLSPEQYGTIKPLVTTLKTIFPELKQVDEDLAKAIASLDVAQLLMTCPGVGPVLSASFISVIDEADRFKSAHQVESYLGLVPSERTSGKRKLGAITKAGNAYLRSLLVQAAWNVLRRPDDDPLKCWGKSLAKKRDKRIAAVAIARRLAGILWAMWRDGTVYDAQNVGGASSRGMRAHAARVAHTADQIAQAS